MRRLTLLLLALSAAALAAGDAKLNGRWDITGESKPRIKTTSGTNSCAFATAASLVLTAQQG